MSFYDAIRVGASGAADFELERSLRFNDDDSTHLSRTPSSAGNRKTFTWSAWIKRGELGATQGRLFGGGVTSTDYFEVYISGDDLLRVIWYAGGQVFTNTTAKFRDPSAWYHFVVAVDTTQSTAADRIKIYVNGVLQEKNNSNAPSQNSDTSVNNTVEHNIGKYLTGGGSHYFDGYMTEINFVDGSALTPSSFAETNADTGQWIPKRPSVTYGTNGFRLNFSDNSGTTATTLGKDFSGNGNNFTPNNFSVSAGIGNDSLEDTPTNNFCTLNPLSLIGTGGTISNGNLDFTGDSNYSTRAGNFSVKTGKWYWEGTPTSVPSASAPQAFGIVRGTNIGSNSYIGYDPNGNVAGFGYFDSGSIKGAPGVGTASGANLATGQTTYTQNDVVGLASDIANGTLAFYKNGTLVYTITGISSLDWFPAQTTYSTGSKNSVNFGQRPFAHTPPTGHQALCSANLPDPTILLPNKHLETLLYSGNESGQSITGLNFEPDWVWIKKRNESASHCLFDSVRGATKRLKSDVTDVELTQTDSLTAFNSDGFTLGGNGHTSENGDTFVAWNWNAGETDSATYTVKVVSDSGNKYRFNNFGTSAVTLDLAEGGTYTFDGSDSSMSGHPFVIGTAANGSVYSTGVTYQLDGASVSYSAYTSGYSSASSRKLIITVPASAPVLYYWCSIHSGMGGQINTNTTLGSSNFDGSIQSTVKANTTAGFSIVSYEGNNVQGATVGHGLGVAPSVVIVKNRESTYNWAVWHTGLLSAAYVLNLNLGSAQGSVPGIFNSTLPTSTVFSLGGGSQGNRFLSNEPNKDFIAYIFSEVAGYSKFGRYIGNGNADGIFVFLGFRPAFVLIKNASAATSWTIGDNKRDSDAGGNAVGKYLHPDSNAQEGQSQWIDFLSNGFKLRGGATTWNGSGNTLIYLAFAESPFKNSRAR